LHEQFGYGYDKAGNLNERTNNALIQSFAVNDRNELSSASQSGTLTVAGTATVPSGNAPYYNDPGVTSVTVNGQSADIYEDGSFAADGFTPVTGQNTYTAIAQDNLYPPRMSTNSVTVNVAGGNSYTYDSNGNLISDGTRSFAYDDENQLVAVWVSNSWSNSFAYDGLLRKRIEQQYTYRSSSRSYLLTNEIHYIYDGNVVVEERDKNNEPLTTYTRGLDLSGTLQGAGGIGGLLARSDNQKIIPAILSPEYPNPQNVVTSFYFNDAQGNVIALVSPGDILLAQYKYDPFGNLISKSGPMADINKYRFSSKEWEENAGLYYYLYRFYDPNLQRWLNRDPIQESSDINLLRFAINSPLCFIDSFGLDERQIPTVLPSGRFPGGVGVPVTNPPVWIPPVPGPVLFTPQKKTLPSPPVRPVFPTFQGKYGKPYRCIGIQFGAPDSPPPNPSPPSPPQKPGLPGQGTGGPQSAS
jgi:RHS repeat-associated protein